MPGSAAKTNQFQSNAIYWVLIFSFLSRPASNLPAKLISVHLNPVRIRTNQIIVN